jgi:hypothetical protein
MFIHNFRFQISDFRFETVLVIIIIPEVIY